MKIKYTVGFLSIFLITNLINQFTLNPSVSRSSNLNLNSHKISGISSAGNDSVYSIPWKGNYGVTETVAQIMERERNNKTEITGKPKALEEFESPRKNLPPKAGFNVSHWPPTGKPVYPPVEPANPQAIGTTFLGIQSSESIYIPPDCMGDAGPTQLLVIANGRIKVFDKSGNLGSLDATTDVFFNSVLNGSSASDPHIRYDRLSQRWFVVMINVASSNNRILIAVSSGSTITASSSFTFFYFQQNQVSPAGDNGKFADYPTLGVDANALYIGVNNFSGTFSSCTGFVVRKSSILGTGPIYATAFRSLCTSRSAGPFTPQGVNNDDPNSTEGYFIGVDNASFSQLDIRRVTNPGGTPSISGNLTITVPTTYFPVNVPAKGSSYLLDAIDDRLFEAQVRKNKITGVSSLWTAHNITVNSSGIGDQNGDRTACRWYQITNLSTTPTLNQAGTLFDGASSNPMYFWMPSVAMTGQGHMSLSSSRAGTNYYAGIVAAGRLYSDALGTTQSFTVTQTSSTSYNLGTPNPQRWGDYSETVVDPNDDMTMWTFQEYCNAKDSWGVRVIQLKAPPPVTPTTATPSAVAPNQTSVDVVIAGSVVNGSGFFDPGSDSGGPGFADHISASLSGGIGVNSVTFNSPTQVTLNLNTTGVTDGYYTVTITNPDGQSATSASGILQINSGLPVELSSFTAKLLDKGVQLNWRTETEVNNFGFEVSRSVDNDYSWTKLGFVKGSGNSNSPKMYSFIDPYVNAGKYYYRLKQIDNDGNFEYSKVIEANIVNPTEFKLNQNYPNPFNPTTTIKYSIPVVVNENFSFTTKVVLKVYDVLGREVATLVNEYKPAGKYTVTFDASKLTSGIYFYRIRAGSYTAVKKMLLLK